MNQFNKPPLGSQIDPEHPLSRGLVACWLMNEGSGNRIQDISGNGNHGVLTGGPLWRPGPRGVALALDGLDDRVLLSNPAIASGNAFSIVTWIYIRGAGFTGANNYSTIIGNSYYNRLLVAIFSGAPVRLLAQMGAGNHLSGNFSIGKNESFLVAYVYDGTNAQWYINGNSSGAPYPCIIGLNANQRLGSFDGANYFLYGRQDELRIYNRALTAQEIAQLYREPYAFIHQPRKYWLMPQGGMIPPHLLIGRRAA